MRIRISVSASISTIASTIISVRVGTCIRITFMYKHISISKRLSRSIRESRSRNRSIHIRLKCTYKYKQSLKYSTKWKDE